MGEGSSNSVRSAAPCMSIAEILALVRSHSSPLTLEGSWKESNWLGAHSRLPPSWGERRTVMRAPWVLMSMMRYRLKYVSSVTDLDQEGNEKNVPAPNLHMGPMHVFCFCECFRNTVLWSATIWRSPLNLFFF